jgi:hypothetical protein
VQWEVGSARSTQNFLLSISKHIVSVIEKQQTLSFKWELEGPVSFTDLFKQLNRYQKGQRF